MNAKKLKTIGLTAAMATGMLAGCGSEASNGAASANQDAASTAAPAASNGSGKVYMLNFKPEADQAWQDLADSYEEETGTEVTVLTAADGQYSTTLQSEMAKSEAPTIFNIGNMAAAQQWKDYEYDLSDSDLYSHLANKDLTLKMEDKVVGIANCYESYGLIKNKPIIESFG